MYPETGRDNLAAEAIRSTLKQMVSEPALSLKFQAKIEVAKSGDLADTQGSYIAAHLERILDRVIASAARDLNEIPDVAQRCRLTIGKRVP